MPPFLFVFKRNIEIISAIGHKEDSSLFVSLLERILLYSYLQDFLINLYSYFRTRQSDIIYIRKINGFAYLSLITDAYSHKIMGYNLRKRFECRRVFEISENGLNK